MNSYSHRCDEFPFRIVKGRVMTTLTLTLLLPAPESCQIHHSWEREQEEQSKENISANGNITGASFQPVEELKRLACLHSC